MRTYTARERAQHALYMNDLQAAFPGQTIGGSIDFLDGSRPPQNDREDAHYPDATQADIDALQDAIDRGDRLDAQLPDV